MEFLKKTPNIDFLGKRKFAIVVSMLLNVAVIVLFLTRGLNYGVDFTGGTVIEVSYANPVEVAEVRKALVAGALEGAAVQHYGTARDVLIRLRVEEGKTTAQQSNVVMEALRAPLGERAIEEESRPGAAQRCLKAQGGTPVACEVQVRRVEFVGPQVGRELMDKGLLGLLFALIGILIYVAFRFEWRFAVGAVIATLHDVLLTIGFFSITRIEFSLVELAAVLTVMGYSINDTVVVFDRIRENFRKLRTDDVVLIMNRAVNETLSRTLMTGVTTLLVAGALFFYGGDSLFGFSAALIFGVLIGTYSSVFVASPSVLMLGLTRADMVAPKKEEAAEGTP
jgi:preprotein translocase subunit SecF